MKLYTFPGAPNPLRVHLFLAEKGIEIDTVVVDLTRQEQLSPEYRRKNPNCDVPMLELDDGTCISQVPAVMTYLEQLYPDPPLYGQSPEAAAKAIMWEHLMAVNGLNAVGDVLRNTSSAMAGRAVVGPHNYDQIRELAERSRVRVSHFFNDLNNRLERSAYVGGEQFTVADITGWVSVNFAGWVKEFPAEELTALGEWYHKLAERPAFQSVLGDN